MMKVYIVHAPEGRIEKETSQAAEETAIEIWTRLDGIEKNSIDIVVEECLDGTVSKIIWDSQNIRDSDIIPFRYQGSKFYLDVGHSNLDSVSLNQIAKERTFGMWERILEYDELNSTTFYSNLRTSNINFSKIGQKIGKKVTTWDQVIADQPHLSEVNQDLKISKSGYSLILRITNCCEMLGVGPGDVVNVTLRRKDLED